MTIGHRAVGTNLTQAEYEGTDTHNGVTHHIAYPLYVQRSGQCIDSNPGISWTSFVPDGGVGATGINVVVDYSTVTYTHARLVATVEGNESGGGKGMRMAIGATNVIIAWNGLGAQSLDSGWVAITSPGGVVTEELECIASSTTEELILHRGTLLFKRET